MKAQYIKGAKLEWPNIWNDLGLSKDKGGRWYAGLSVDPWIKDYCDQFRTPSRAYPYSHAKPLLTQKFAKLLTEKNPELAIKLGVAQEVN